MGEHDRYDIDELVRSHAEGDVTIRQIATLVDLSHKEAYELVDSMYENADLGDDKATPVTYTPDDFTNEDLTEAYQENASHAAETNDEWSIVSTEANEHLGEEGDDDPEPTTFEPTSPDDAEKIRIAEQWRRGEISEGEARQQLGDDTIDGIIEDREAFREAMRRDTSGFLQSE